MIPHSLRRQLPLIALFMLALPIFCWLRWQPQVWFADQLAANGLNGQLSYAAVEKSFPGLRLSKAVIRLSDGKLIPFDRLQLRPAFASLLSGSPALFFRAERLDLTAQGALSNLGEELILSDIDLNVEADQLAAFDARLQLLGLKGKIRLVGDIKLRRVDGIPLTGEIHASWQKAASLLLPTLQGGEITASISTTGDKSASPAWAWAIASDPQSISGTGKLVSNGTRIEDWLLRGSIKLAGNDTADGIVLSGTLGTPHWQ